jgi:hypothetical protein
MIRKLRNIVHPDIKIYSHAPQLEGFSINSQQIVKDVCKLLSISPDKKAYKVKLPTLSDELTWSFIRGYFDGDGSIRKLGGIRRSPSCSITSNSKDMRDAIQNFCKIPCSNTLDKLEWSGNNALDFLGKLYDNTELKLSRKYDRYLDWTAWIPVLQGIGSRGKLGQFKWIKTPSYHLNQGHLILDMT